MELYAKAEWLNPGGSVKDRAALKMVADAELNGELTSDKIILDATSGNTGIALAMIGAALKYGVELVMPENVSQERKTTLQALGAKVVYTNPLEGIDGAIRRVKQMFEDTPDRYFYADQYSNESNWRAHYLTTGEEIIEQTGGKITHFVAGVGTGGTLMGVSRKLKEHDRSIKICEVQPDSPFHGLEGLKHMESALVPEIYDPQIRDELLLMSTEESQSFTIRLAREHGILVGPSSGAALAASIKAAEDIEKGVIVTIFPDSGLRYASEKFWTD